MNMYPAGTLLEEFLDQLKETESPRAACMRTDSLLEKELKSQDGNLSAELMDEIRELGWYVKTSSCLAGADMPEVPLFLALYQVLEELAGFKDMCQVPDGLDDSLRSYLMEFYTHLWKLEGGLSMVIFGEDGLLWSDIAFSDPRTRKDEKQHLQRFLQAVKSCQEEDPPAILLALNRISTRNITLHGWGLLDGIPCPIDSGDLQAIIDHMELFPGLQLEPGKMAGAFAA